MLCTQRTRGQKKVIGHGSPRFQFIHQHRSTDTYWWPCLIHLPGQIWSSSFHPMFAVASCNFIPILSCFATVGWCTIHLYGWIHQVLYVESIHIFALLTFHIKTAEIGRTWNNKLSTSLYPINIHVLIASHSISISIPPVPQDNLGSPQGDGNGKLDDWKPPEEALLMEMSKHKQRKHGHEQS